MKSTPRTKNTIRGVQEPWFKLKKCQKNLEYELKQLKQCTRSTGEAGIKSIKDGFPYFNVFDEVMGHRDSVDPSKMAIEGSAKVVLQMQ